jgi:hypothetical protein
MLMFNSIGPSRESSLAPPLTTDNTGNPNFAECQNMSTRQSTDSTKSLFAEWRTLGTVQHSAKSLFAECQALSKPWHSAKADSTTQKC